MARPQRARVGSLAWAEQTGGRLRRRDRLRLLGQGLTLQTREVPAQVFGRLGVRPWRLARFDLDELRIPDTAVCRAAEEICSNLRPEVLVGHSYRTFAWATIIGRHRGLAFDEETLFVASLLHDAGLSDPYRAAPNPTCFTLVGAQLASDLGKQHGWDVTRSRGVAGTVTQHLNPRPPGHGDPEAYLLLRGAQLDVAGVGYWRVAADTRSAVLSRWPRNGAKKGLAAVFAENSRAHPGSRARMLNRYLGLPLLIRGAPFSD